MRLRLPNLPLTVTVLSWGFNFVALKVLYPEMTAPAVALVRYVAMLATLVPLCWLLGHRLRYEPGDALRLNLGGALAMGGYMVLFLEGMAGTTPAEGAIVLATSPVFTYLLSSALRVERFLPWALAGACLAFVGVALVVAGGGVESHGTLRGNGLILASAVVWACATLVMRPYVVRLSPLRALTLSMPGALPILLVYGGAATWRTDFTRLSPTAWAMFAQVALLSGVVAFLGFYAGVAQVGPGRATLYQFFVPPIAAFFAWRLLGQALAPAQFAGLAVVIAGVGLATWARLRPEPISPTPDRTAGTLNETETN